MNNIRKVSMIAALSVLLGGCCAGTYCGSGNKCTYGIENDKWAVMSQDQRQSAKEVYRLDQLRMAEQHKLNQLNYRKQQANAHRESQYREEKNDIERENLQIHDQQSKVGSITAMERLKQKQREQDLDNLKG